MSDDFVRLGAVMLDVIGEPATTNDVKPEPGGQWMPQEMFDELAKLREERSKLIAQHNEAAEMIAQLRNGLGVQTGRVVALEQQIVSMQDEATRLQREASMQSVKDITSLRVRLVGALAAVQALTIAIKPDCEADFDD
jgi:hypothetical protein